MPSSKEIKAAVGLFSGLHFREKKALTTLQNQQMWRILK